jgi:hypothetical protein
MSSRDALRSQPNLRVNSAGEDESQERRLSS